MPGPGPISNDTTCRPYDFDALMHEATTVHNERSIPHDVHLSTPTPAADSPEIPLAATGVDVAVHAAGDGVEAGAGGGAATFAPTVLAPFAALGLGLMEIAHEDAVGRRGMLVHDRDVLRGALAAMEGRASDPRVVEERRHSPGFDEGFTRIDLFMTQQFVRGPEILAAVRSSMAAGTQAVFAGSDHGPAFECRYQQDVVFHHAVDYQRWEREIDPVGFEERRALAVDVQRHRAMPQTRG